MSTYDFKVGKTYRNRYGDMFTVTEVTEHVSKGIIQHTAGGKKIETSINNASGIGGWHEVPSE